MAETYFCLTYFCLLKYVAMKFMASHTINLDTLMALSWHFYSFLCVTVGVGECEAGGVFATGWVELVSCLRGREEGTALRRPRRRGQDLCE